MYSLIEKNVRVICKQMGFSHGKLIQASDHTFKSMQDLVFREIECNDRVNHVKDCKIFIRDRTLRKA